MVIEVEVVMKVAFYTSRVNADADEQLSLLTQASPNGESGTFFVESGS